jgi:uncharacterized membrane protein YhaH (DUF805 family)
MTLADAVKLSLAHYATFSGRSRRSEYWYFTLAQVIAIAISYIAMLVLPALGIILYLLVILGTFIPHLALSIRRLHDTDRSGWWYLLGFVPFVGGIILLVWFCTDGTSAANTFGENPKATVAVMGGA